MISKNKQELEKKREILFKDKKEKVFKLYNRGYSLGKISRNTLIDFTTVLRILRKCRIKRNLLYKIFEKQITYQEDSMLDLIMKNDKIYVDKFFPNFDKRGEMDDNYFWYWKKELEKLTEKRKNCPHKVKNITCAKCGKILGDASNIEIYDFSKTNNCN